MTQTSHLDINGYWSACSEHLLHVTSQSHPNYELMLVPAGHELRQYPSKNTGSDSLHFKQSLGLGP